MNEPHVSERHDLVPRRQLHAGSSQGLRMRAVPASDLGDGDGLSADFILGILRRWWLLIVPCGLVLAAGASALVIYFHKPSYEAKGLISIEASRQFVAFPEGTNQKSDQFVATQLELLRSPIVLQPVVARPEVASLPEIKLATDPFEALSKNLSVRQVGRSEFYEISYVSADADTAATIVNAVIAEYMNKRLHEESERTNQVIARLDEAQARHSDVVQQRRKQVLELAKNVTGRDPFGQGTMLDVSRVLSPLGSIYQQQSALEVRARVLEAEIQSLRDEPILTEDRAVTSGLLDLEIANRPEIRQLRDQVELAKYQMEEMKAKLLNNTWQTNKHFLKLQADVEAMEKALADETARVRSQILEARAIVRDQERAQLLAAKESELRSLTTQLQLLAAKYQEHVSKLGNNDVASVELEFAKAALDREERVFELIEQRKLALQTELRAPDRVSVAQRATPPKRPVEPIPYKLLAVACLGAMMTPLGLAALREITVKKISTPDQLVHESKQRLLGEVARFPVRPLATGVRRLSSRAQHEMYIFAESIDSVRTSLMLSESLACQREGCVWAIVSAASGEGKTSVATSLAVSFASATKTPTLIIDADLRAPDVAEVLGTPGRPGFAEVLEEKVTLSDAIRRVGDTNTYVLPAGRAKGNPHHLVDSTKVAKLLESLRPNFPHIIIDTPPVLSASESLIYAKAADYVVYCALRDTTRAKQLRSAVSRLHDAGAQIAGAVLSGMPVNSYAYAYGVYGASRQDA